MSDLTETSNPSAGGTPAAGASDGAGASGAPAAGGAPAPVFADTLPADIRTDAAFRDIRDLDGLARGYLGAQKLIGIPRDRLLELPADPANTEAMGRLYDRLGRPEAPDKYAFKTDGLPEGVTRDEATETWFRQVAHKEGLSMAQAARIFDAWNVYVGGRIGAKTAADATAHAAAETALKTEWGAAYDEKLRIAKDALRHYGGAKAEEIAARYGSDPDLARIFAEVGEVLREHGVIGRGSGGAGAGALAPVEAQQQISARYADTEFLKRLQSRDPEIKRAAQDEMDRLFAMAYPEQRPAA